MSINVGVFRDTREQESYPCQCDGQDPSCHWCKGTGNAIVSRNVHDVVMRESEAIALLQLLGLDPSVPCQWDWEDLARYRSLLIRALNSADIEAVAISPSTIPSQVLREAVGGHLPRIQVRRTPVIHDGGMPADRIRSLLQRLLDLVVYAQADAGIYPCWCGGKSDRCASCHGTGQTRQNITWA